MTSFVRYVFAAFFLIFVSYIGLSVTPSEFLPSVERERILTGNLILIGKEIWDFVRPLLQLVLMVLIIEYVVSKISGKSISAYVAQLADIKSLIAIIVVLAFSISALSGSDTAHLLKDVALVVIGFYFGGAQDRKSII